MIDEELTYQKYGYKSTDLKRWSGKLVVRRCNNCDRIDDTIFQNQAFSLCRSCAHSGDKNGMCGRYHTKSTLDKISNSLKGKFLGKNNPFYGKTHTDETKKIMSEYRLGTHLSDKTKKKISDSTSGDKNHNYGKTMPDNVKEKLSKSVTGFKHADESKELMSISRRCEDNAFYGKKHTEETRKKMKDNNLHLSGKESHTYKHEIDEFIKENQGKHFCHCGCGKEIEIKRQYFNDGIPKLLQNHKPSGENNPLFGIERSLESRIKNSCSKRGISIENFSGFGTDYCDKFNQKLRTKIRNSYNNCDYISGLPDYICNVLNGKVWKLDIHHIDYNTRQGCDNHKWALIPLSRSNHGKTNRLRSFWNRLFVYALEYDINYYNSEDGYFNVFKVI